MSMECCKININNLNKFLVHDPCPTIWSILSKLYKMTDKFTGVFSNLFHTYIKQYTEDNEFIYGIESFYEYNYDSFNYKKNSYTFNQNIGEAVSSTINILEVLLFPKNESIENPIWLVKPRGDNYVNLEYKFKDKLEGHGAGNKKVLYTFTWSISMDTVYETFTPSEAILIEGTLKRLKKTTYNEINYNADMSSLKYYNGTYDFYMCKLLGHTFKYWLCNKFRNILRSFFGKSPRDIEDIIDIKINKRGYHSIYDISATVIFDHIPYKDEF